MAVKKYDLIDYFLLILMYLQLVILEFFGFGRTLNKVVTVLILYRVLFMRGRHWKIGLMCSAGLGIIYILGLLLGDTFNGGYALSNFLIQFYPMVYTYFIVFLRRNKPEVIDSCLQRGFWIFNITMIANIIVLLMQIFAPYSVIAVVDETQYISYYEDNISGLFQYASTHVVCLFTIFIVLYDISHGKELKKGIRALERALIIIMIAVVLFIAANSDNKAFFLLFPLALFAYWYAGDMSSIKRYARVMVGIILIPLIIYGLYIGNAAVREVIDTNVLKTLDLIVAARNLGASANGSKERVAIIFDGLSMFSTWLVGKGFGSTSIYGSGFLGYNHFGQADLGSILVLGGIWYLLLLLYYYLKSFSIIIGVNSLKNHRALTWSVVVIVISVAVYTQSFTRTNVISTLILMMLAFRGRRKEITKVYH